MINPNDAGDTDTGPNDLLNFPVITAASTDRGQRARRARGCTVEVSKASGAAGTHGLATLYLGSATADAVGRVDATS